MFETQIARGMEWLDQRHPGWEHRVDVNTLDLHDCDECVLGQLTGSWWSTGEELFGAVRPFYTQYDTEYDTNEVARRREFNVWSQARGFSIDYSSLNIANAHSAYRILTQEWVEAILAKRAAMDEVSREFNKMIYETEAAVVTTE